MSIKNANSVQEAIDIAKGKELVYPKRPTKPLQSHFDKNSSGMRMYADKLEEYEKDFEVYTSEMKKYRDHKNILDSQIVDFIKDFSGLNSIVPEQYRSKVYTYAYQQGHSSGYSEVAIILENLVEIFE